MDVILMNGAPGTGKTTVGSLLHEYYKSPWFEFGWIPEFRRLNPHTEISYEEWVDAIKATVPPKFLEVNLKAFDLGYNL